MDWLFLVSLPVDEMGSQHYSLRKEHGSYRPPKTHPYRYAMAFLLPSIKASPKAIPDARKQTPLLHGDHTAKECTYQDTCNQWPYLFLYHEDMRKNVAIFLTF